MVCGTAYMARRFIVDTWNNAAAPKKVKPVEPLRYRINPLDKEYDKLDALEAELERTADKMEPDHYHDLYDSLQARRERLDARHARMQGKAPAKAKAATTEAPARPKRYKPRANVSPLALKVLGVCLALILFKIFA